MDGNAAIWLQSYKQCHELRLWPQFISAVEAEFGADDQRKCLKALLALKQVGTVDEYHKEFQTLVYQVSMYNPHYDEQFYISQFIKGLKPEIRGMVESQVPQSLERAILLACVQQEVTEDARPHGQRHIPNHRLEGAPARAETPKPAVKLATCEYWKERQLRDYRRNNGLCFKCGEKYDPTHICNQKLAATLNVMSVNEDPIQLSEEILNIMELQDIATAEQLSLSINAMAGSEGDDCLRLHALVGNQVMIILLGSGSSNCFLNAAMLDRIKCTVKEVPPMAVKVANGEYMYTNQSVPELSWWSHGVAFTTSMRVVDLGRYDAILGMDWLKQHSPMTTDWNKKFISFPYKGQHVTLHGVQPVSPTEIREIPVEQLAKWKKGNEVWALAVVHPDAQADREVQSKTPPEVQSLLTEFDQVFAEPTALPPPRQYDHAIALESDTAPFNTRPYRYSPAHKDEIERQVSAMLAARIIVPSMSPFASPVLLIQKKKTELGDSAWTTAD